MYLFTSQLTRYVGGFKRMMRSTSNSSSLLKTPPVSPPPPLAPLAIALFDGSCPMCAKEIAWLQSFKTAKNRVDFIDVSGPSFDAQQWSQKRGITPPIQLGTLLSEMHVVDTTKNKLHTRVPAFRFLYATMGFDILSFTAREGPWASRSDTLYTYIAENKHRLAFLFR